MEPYTQLAVWEGVVLEDHEVADFTEFMQENLGSRVKFSESVYTLPDMKTGEPVPETGGRSDLFFYVHNDDIPAFAVKRFGLGDGCPRWWEDVLGNGHGKLYPQEILDKYPKTW
tara:strand:- start:717 stop:1058 length:342 start_codon:yes stop_codon:yes gene_type:complete